MKSKTRRISPQKKFFVYLLLCADGTIYCGYTTDPERRVSEHNSGKGSKYTRGRRPVRLAYLEEAGSISEALSREAGLKSLSRLEKLELCRRFHGH